MVAERHAHHGPGGHFLVTHRFPLAETMAAYDAFANAGQGKALKVVLQNS